MRLKGSINSATPQRRRAILDSALAVFLERGIMGATLDALCAAAEVSRGTLYHHFASKEEIAVELYAQASESLRLSVAPAFVDQASFGAGIEAVVDRYLQWFAKHPELGGFMLRVMDSELLAIHVAHVREQEAAFVSEVLDWVSSYVKSGVALAAPSRILVSLVIGPARDFVRDWVVKKDPRELRKARQILPHAARVAVTA